MHLWQNYLLSASALLCFISVHRGECCWGKSAPKHGYMTEDYDLLSGSELVLNCTLHSHEVQVDSQNAKHYVNSSHLLFKKGSRDFSSAIHIVDDLTAQIRISNASSEDSGMYYCELVIPDVVKQVVCSSKVSIGYPPKPVKDFRCISRFYKNLTCTWNVEDTGVQTKYTLYKQLFPSSFFTFDANVPLQSCPLETSNSTYCQWRENTDPPFQFKESQFTFILLGNNSLGSSRNDFIFNHSAILMPDMPQNFMAVEINTQNLTLQWTLPVEMANRKDRPPLKYEMWVKEITKESSEIKVIDIGIDVMEYTIIDLIPFMRYNLSLRSRSNDTVGDDMWGPFATIQVQLQPDVPYYIPDIIPEIYELRHYDGYRTATLYWKPVPEKHFNGKNFMYHVACFQNVSIEGEAIRPVQTLSVLSLKATFRNLSEDSSYIFYIYSSNDKGLSSNYNSVILRKQSKLPPLPRDVTVVSRNAGHYMVSWEETKQNSSDILDYVVLWCSSLKPWLSRCDGPIQWLPDPVQGNKVALNLSDSATNFQFAVAARSANASSGIHWTTCIAVYTAAPRKIVNMRVEAKSSSSLKVIWQLDCPAQKEVVKKFEIVYCRLNENKQCHGRKKSVEISNPKAESFLLENLEPFSNYSAIVRAYNDVGVSENSDPFFQTTLEAAPFEPPQNVQITAVPNASLKVSWHPPSQQYGIVTHYYLKHNGKEEIIEADPKQSAYQKYIHGLLYYTNYSIILTACVKAHCSPEYEGFARTEIGVPGEMDPPRIELVNSTSVKILWNHPLRPNGPISFYETIWQLQENENASVYNELHNKTVLSGHSTVVDLGCKNFKDDGIKYIFFIRAVNVKEGKKMYGPLSDGTQTIACFVPQGSAMIIGVAVGGTFALAIVIILVYKLIKWMSEKIHQVKSITVRLPNGLDGPETNPLNNYENFKNGLVDQNSVINGINRLSYIIDDSDNKNRHGSGSSQYSASSTDELLYRNGKCTKFGRKPSGDSSGCSSMSSNTAKLHHSSDSGTESDFMTPPSPDFLCTNQNYHGFSKHPLSVVMEAHDVANISSTLKNTGQEDFVKQLENESSLTNGILLKINQPYSKFGITSNVDITSPWWMNSLAFYSNNLSNSEPSVVDIDYSSKIYMPYSKVGLAKSSDNLFSLPSKNYDMGYSKFGIIPNYNNLQFKSSDENDNFYPELKSSTVGVAVLAPNGMNGMSHSKVIEMLKNYGKIDITNTKSNFVGSKVFPKIYGELKYISANKFNPKNGLNGLNGFNDDSGYVKVGLQSHNSLIAKSGYVPLNKMTVMSQDESLLRNSIDTSAVPDKSNLNAFFSSSKNDDVFPSEFVDYDVQSSNDSTTDVCIELEPLNEVEQSDDFLTAKDESKFSDISVPEKSGEVSGSDFAVSNQLTEIPTLFDSAEAVNCEGIVVELEAEMCDGIKEKVCAKERIQESLPESCILEISSNEGDVHDCAPTHVQENARNYCSGGGFNAPTKGDVFYSADDVKYEPDSISNEKIPISTIKKNGYVPFSTLVNTKNGVDNVPKVSETLKTDSIDAVKSDTLPLKNNTNNTSVHLMFTDDDLKVPQTIYENRTSVKQVTDLPSLNIPTDCVNSFDNKNFCLTDTHKLRNDIPENTVVDYLYKFPPRVESEICEV